MKILLPKAISDTAKTLLAFLLRTRFREQIIRLVFAFEHSVLFKRRPFSDLLIEILYRQQRYEKVAEVYRREKPSDQLYPSSLIKSLVRTSEANSVRIELDKFLRKSSIASSQYLHIYETAMSFVNFPHEERVKIRNERMANLEVASEDREKWHNMLITNGLLWKLEQLETQKLVTDSVSKRVAELKEFQGDLLPFSTLAGQNNCRTLSDKVAIQGEQRLTYSELGGAQAVELNIPASFFFHQNDTNLRSVRRHLLDFYLLLIKHLIAQKIPFIPILQFGWNATALGSGNYVFSHHTTGGGEKHFHIKTSAIKGFVSLDKDGFAGWSSLARESQKTRDAISEIDDALAESTWIKVFDRIVTTNFSKYSQPDQEGNAFAFDYIFLPLQIAGDLVASLSHISGTDLATFFVEKFRGSRYKVVIKRHPLCQSNETAALLKQLGAEEHVIISRDSVHDLIKNAALVATVNSGVGMEAILHLKNVIITGDADYFYCATLAKNLKQLDDFVESGTWKQPKDSELKKFVHYYFNDYLIDSESSQQVATRLQAIGL